MRLGECSRNLEASERCNELEEQAECRYWLRSVRVQARGSLSSLPHKEGGSTTDLYEGVRERKQRNGAFPVEPV